MTTSQHSTCSIPLHNKKGAVIGSTQVDCSDAEWLNQWKWILYAGRYAARTGRHGNDRTGRPWVVLMHREILGLPAEPGRQAAGRMEGDHINGDTVDNRRSNLRVVTHAQNSQNRRGPNANSSTGVRGVSWHKHTRSYQATLKADGKRVSVGYFKTVAEADTAVRDARKRLMPYSSEAQKVLA